MRRAALVGVCLFAGITQVHAAPATAEEAQRLVDEFHRYFGSPRAGQADHVRVVPDGEAYRVTIDLDQLAEPFEPMGLSLDPAELSFLTEPLPDSTWSVTDFLLPSPMTIRVAGQTITYRWEGGGFEGIYDPSLASFLSFEQVIATTSSEARSEEGVSTAHVGEQVVRGTSTDTGEGTVDTEFQQTFRDYVGQETISLPSADPKEPASPPIEFAYSIATGTIDVSLEGFDAVGLLELWAYAVARMQEDPPKVDAEELKASLGALLPFFTRLDEGATIGGLRVGTPFGDFGMEEVDFRVTLPGLVEGASLAMSLALSGPTYPAELVPAWAQELAPTEVVFGYDIASFNLNAPAQHLLTAFDADRTPPIEDSDYTAAAMMALPESGATLTVSPSNIDGPILDVAFEGQLTLAMPAPTGTFTVTATGFDIAKEKLTAASADPMATQALGLLTVAEMFGRKTDDGSMVFVIEFKGDGSIAVNDQVVKPPAGDPT